MTTECTSEQMEFQGFGGRKVQGAFDGGPLSSDGGSLLLREVDLCLGITEQFAACFRDERDASRIEHSVLELIRQRVYGIGLGYEDLNDNDTLQRDPLLALGVGREDIHGENRRRAADKGKALASSSTLNRMELTAEEVPEDERYKKISCQCEAIEPLFVKLFLDSFEQAPEEIILDFDATDDPIHGTQEGRFFHGYYGGYCYMPLYVFCDDHLLAAQLRPSNRDASAGAEEILEKLVTRIRERWSDTRIILRADSGFSRDPLLSWCEANDVYYVVGYAKNDRLTRRIRKQQFKALRAHKQSGLAERVFTEFRYRTRSSWSRSRRLVAKAEHLEKGPNPRFIVTNLPGHLWHSDKLYEKLYCARGEMENRIKEQQLDLFADRTSTHTMRANQLRLWFSSLAYVLVSALRRIALRGTKMARATCGTIRLRLFKIAASIKTTVRRHRIQLSSACPAQKVFLRALKNIHAYTTRE